MPNLNLEAGQIWRTNNLIVNIKKIEGVTVYYTQRAAVTQNQQDSRMSTVTILDFQDWITRRNAKYKKQPISSKENSLV